ncbi:MAG: penicillin-binding protein [Psychrilyobacter sp.]|nr:penicillin-binding protein [Psychrilyobacter sp.]
MGIKSKVKNIFKKYRKKILMGILVAFLLLTSFTIFTYYSVRDRITSYTSSEPIIIYDKDGFIVDYLSQQKGDQVDIENTPIFLQKAFIAVEDKRFYSHPGIDIIRLGGATIKNILKGRIVAGGSTISQQLSKNVFLSNERTFSRKYKELIITFEVERIYSKDQILEKYLNEIYFGAGTYGVNEAAKDIFNKDLSQLNLPESALLAGIPNRPNYYDPRKHLDNAIKRSHIILKLMFDQKYISKDQYDKAISYKFVMKNTNKNYTKNTTIIFDEGRRRRNSVKAPDFVDIIENKLVDLVDPKILAKGGFKVYTTLDEKMQQTAKSTFQNYSRFKKDKKLQGAMITLDANTGEIRSIIGGYNYHSGDFNRGVEAKRQIGSTFKPFVYYTALEKGYTMNQMIDGSSVKYGDWTPKNYGNAKYQDITLIQSLEKSINTIAVKLLDEVGVNSVVDNFNKTSIDVEFDKNLTIALGSLSTSPLELATAYLPFANGGYAMTPSFITRIEDVDGNIIYENEKLDGVEVFDPINTSLMTYMLEKVVEYGSGKGAKIKSKHGFPIDQGGKTGTSNDYRSAWYAGITPDYVTVVYMGYDDNTSMPNGSAGGSLAAPMWRSFYQTMIDDGTYMPTKFEFIKDSIDSGELVRRDIDIRTGEVKKAPTEFRREILFKKDQAPKSSVRKIWNGFKGWFK